VEEVGRVVYSVRGLSFTNHQSSIINHPARNAVWPFGFSPEGALTVGLTEPTASLWQTHEETVYRVPTQRKFGQIGLRRL